MFSFLTIILCFYSGFTITLANTASALPEKNFFDAKIVDKLFKLQTKYAGEGVGVLFFFLFTSVILLPLCFVFFHSWNDLLSYFFPSITILFYFIGYRYFRKKHDTTKERIVLEQELYTTQHLPMMLQMLQDNVFAGKALFSCYDNHLYIKYPLQHDYLHIPIWYTHSQTKQRIIQDLGLFLGVLKWMEDSL